MIAYILGSNWQLANQLGNMVVVLLNSNFKTMLLLTMTNQITITTYSLKAMFQGN